MTEILIGSTTIGAIIIFLGKFLINKGFDTALKSYENKLDLLKIEHQIKYSKLHEERGVILKDLYKQLYTLEKFLREMTTTWQGSDWTTDTERKSKAQKQLLDCEDLLETNRIFFSKEFF